MKYYFGFIFYIRYNLIKRLGLSKDVIIELVQMSEDKVRDYLWVKTKL